MKFEKWLMPVSILLMFVIGLLLYPSLPNELPRQWDWNGEIGSTWPKLQAILFPPFIAIGVWLLMYLAPKIDPRREQYEKFAPTYRRMQQGIVVFMLGMQVITLTQYDNPDAVAKLIFFGISSLLVFMGNEMGRFRQTWFLGIRTPWTLADERVWRMTHRIGGRFYVLFGIVNMVAVFLLPMPILGAFFLTTLLLVSFGLMAYSYYAWRQLYG